MGEDSDYGDGKSGKPMRTKSTKNFGRDDSMGEMDVNASGPPTTTTEYGKTPGGKRVYKTEERVRVDKDGVSPASKMRPKSRFRGRGKASGR